MGKLLQFLYARYWHRICLRHALLFCAGKYVQCPIDSTLGLIKINLRFNSDSFPCWPPTPTCHSATRFRCIGSLWLTSCLSMVNLPSYPHPQFTWTFLVPGRAQKYTKLRSNVTHRSSSTKSFFDVHPPGARSRRYETNLWWRVVRLWVSPIINATEYPPTWSWQKMYNCRVRGESAGKAQR